MTAEEAHWHYKNARNRYNEAIQNKNQCQTELYNCEQERKRVFDALNEHQGELNKYLAAKESIAKTDIREKLDTGLTKMSAEMGDASDFFRTIASSSSGEIDLAAHIMNEDAKKKSRTAVGSIFEKIGNAKTSISNAITRLQDSVKSEQNAISDLDSRIRNAQNNINYWENVRRGAENDMSVYSALERKLAAQS